VILRELGSAFGDEAMPDASTVAAGVATALRGVTDLGAAQVGDKTLVDVLFTHLQLRLLPVRPVVSRSRMPVRSRRLPPMKRLRARRAFYQRLAARVLTLTKVLVHLIRVQFQWH